MGTVTSTGLSSWETKMSLELNSGSDGVSREVGELTWRKKENYYKILNNIGKGSFGQVVLALVLKSNTSILRPEPYKVGTLMEPLKDSMYRLHTLVAIKIMKKQMSNYSRVKEVRCINAIPSHPALVQIFDIFIDHTTGQLHIVMETMNQNLYQLMAHRKNTMFSSETLKSILTQLLSAIRHLHRHDYFHRDVKPENILVIPTFQYYGDKSKIPFYREKDSYVVKLADYGLARHINDQRPYTEYVATRWYRSPEILLRKKWYSKPCDIWAFGTIAVELANVVPLFPGKNELDQIGRILSILGNPTPSKGSLEPSNSSKVPLGGYWKEADSLSKALGIELLPTDGVLMDDIMPNGAQNDLSNMAQACLTWDPVARADVETLCAMPFFKGTDLALEYVDPERITAKSEDQISSHTKFIQKINKNLPMLTSQYNTSEYYAGSTSKSTTNIQTSNLLDENKPMRIFDDIDDGYEYEFQSNSLFKHSQPTLKNYSFTGEFHIPLPLTNSFDIPYSDTSGCVSSGAANEECANLVEIEGETEPQVNEEVDVDEVDNYGVNVSSSSLREYLAVPSGNRANYSYSIHDNDANNYCETGASSEYWRKKTESENIEAHLSQCITLVISKGRGTSIEWGTEKSNNSEYSNELQKATGGHLVL